MMRAAAMIWPLARDGAASACSAGDVAAPFAPGYCSIQTDLAGDDLVNFPVSMTGARDTDAAARYGECAAAGYLLIRGCGFARHLRRNIADEAGIWRGDAVYTISPALPRGPKTIDAEVVAADCAVNGIPMV